MFYLFVFAPYLYCFVILSISESSLCVHSASSYWKVASPLFQSMVGIWSCRFQWRSWKAGFVLSNEWETIMKKIDKIQQVSDGIRSWPSMLVDWGGISHLGRITRVEQVLKPRRDFLNVFLVRRLWLTQAEFLLNLRHKIWTKKYGPGNSLCNVPSFEWRCCCFVLLFLTGS